MFYGHDIGFTINYMHIMFIMDFKKTLKDNCKNTYHYFFVKWIIQTLIKF